MRSLSFLTFGVGLATVVPALAATAPTTGASVPTLAKLELRLTQPADTAAPLPPLPPDDPATGRVTKEPPVSTAPATDDQTTASTPLVRRAVPLDPYEPLGISAGGFILYP